MASSNTPSPAVVARLLLPDDANPAGNVHGGTTLKLMEEAGMIAATRHMASSEKVNAEKSGNCVAGLVRFEVMSFHKPIFVGELASCSCEVIFTSNQSILVEVSVCAEDISKGERRVTNTGWLWYVPMAPTSVDPNTGEETDWRVQQVVPMDVPKAGVALMKYEKAKAKYETRKQKKSSALDGSCEDNETATSEDGEFKAFKEQYTAPPEGGRTPTSSSQLLCQMVLPGDCAKGGIAFGGFVMKLMDNAAGCSAFRHCRTNVVTVAISDMDFVSWVRLGDLCTVRSKVVFASSKSLEIEVVASVASISKEQSQKGEEEDTVVARGLFTFVSIGSKGKVLPVPALILESDEDLQNAYAGQKRYEAAKKDRLKG